MDSLFSVSANHFHFRVEYVYREPSYPHCGWYAGKVWEQIYTSMSSIGELLDQFKKQLDDGIPLISFRNFVWMKLFYYRFGLDCFAISLEFSRLQFSDAQYWQVVVQIEEHPPKEIFSDRNLPKQPWISGHNSSHFFTHPFLKSLFSLVLKAYIFSYEFDATQF